MGLDPVTPASFITMSSRNHEQTSLSQKEAMVLEEIKVILKLESTTYATRFDYISYSSDISTTNKRKALSESLRRKISEWSFEVVDHFGFDREVVGIALNYADRVATMKTLELEKEGKQLDRKQFQLIAVAALYIAVKLHGETDVSDNNSNTDNSDNKQESSSSRRGTKVEIQAFVELSRGLLTVETLQEMELEMLHMLQWNVNPPTMVRIVAILLSLMPLWTVYDDRNSQAYTTTVSATYEMASYLTELSLCVSAISFPYKPSEIAFASILCAIEAVQHKVQIPYAVRLGFLHKVTFATTMTPQSVAPVCNFLRNLQTLHPDMFTAFSTDATNTANDDNDYGPNLDRNISPICVVPNPANNSTTTTTASPHKWY
mmetsp:Transcript_2159/g.3107  ORF Transcript_2159/g.3107 Transcript_2159/m.3107 type:complete len:375 (-) Transcript_2159:139-1263(-)